MDEVCAGMSHWQCVMYGLRRLVSNAQVSAIFWIMDCSCCNYGGCINNDVWRKLYATWRKKQLMGNVWLMLGYAKLIMAGVWLILDDGRWRKCGVRYTIGHVIWEMDVAWWSNYDVYKFGWLMHGWCMHFCGCRTMVHIRCTMYDWWRDINTGGLCVAGWWCMIYVVRHMVGECLWVMGSGRRVIVGGRWVLEGVWWRMMAGGRCGDGWRLMADEWWATGSSHMLLGGGWWCRSICVHMHGGWCLMGDGLMYAELTCEWQPHDV